MGDLLPSETKLGFKLAYDLKRGYGLELKELTIVFLHGNETEDVFDIIWIKNLREEFKKYDFNNVVFETLPDPFLARKKYWFEYLEGKKINKNTILIGWSSGALCAMRWSEGHEIFGSVLIAPQYKLTEKYYEEEKQSGFFEKKWGWKRMKENQRFIIQINSNNDEFIPKQQFLYVKRNLNSNYHEIKNKGHFTHEEDMSFIAKILLEEISKND